jgi:chorismate synthase
VTILEGLPAGLPLSVEMVNDELARRQRGYGAGPRMKMERDQVQVLSGVMAGVTTGSPLAMRIVNLNHERWSGQAVDPFTTPRPGHADLSAAVKYGYGDLRLSLERASARETAARVAVGGVCKQLLSRFGLQVGGYVTEIGGVVADLEGIPLIERVERAEESDVRCPQAEGAERIRARIRQAIEERDTLGGVIETVAWGVPPGLGSHVHWDRKLDARLGAALLSVQAIKGVEIGQAFKQSRLPGTQAHDPIHLNEEELTRPSNRAGGIEGGISNGQPILLRAAMKPIATTLTPQQTVDLATGKATQTVYERSDFCPVPRAVPILEGVVAVVLADALLEKLGGDSLDEMEPRFAALRQARLSDLPMDDNPSIFWDEP